MSRPLCFDMFRPTTKANFPSYAPCSLSPTLTGFLGRQVDEITPPTASKCTRSTSLDPTGRQQARRSHGLRDTVD